MPSLQTSAIRDAPPNQLSVPIQGRGKPTLLYSTVYAYVPLLYTLLLRKSVPLFQT